MQTARHHIEPWSYLASQRDSASFAVLLASTGAHILDEVYPSVSKSPYIPKIWLSTLVDSESTSLMLPWVHTRLIVV
jgi:hypothetical protein